MAIYRRCGYTISQVFDMIESMKLEDVKAVFQLHQQELRANWSLMLYKQELLDLNTRAYVYKQDDKVVGFIIAKYIGVTSDLLQIAVDKKYQKQKIGYYLLDYVWKELVHEGVEEMILEVRAKHTDVIAFYERFGFKILYARKNYYGPRRDALVMRKQVNDA